MILLVALMLLAWNGGSKAAAPLQQTVTPAPVYLPAILSGVAPGATPSATASPTPTETATVTETPEHTPTPTPTLPWVAIVEEGFERDFPAGWEVFDNLGGSGEYFWAKRDCRVYEGSYSAWAVGGGANGASLTCMSQYPNSAASWMIYGPFSLEQATAAEMRVMVWLNTQREKDYILLAASKDNNLFYGVPFSGDLDGWQERLLNLAQVPTLGNLLGEPYVWIALIFVTDSNTSLFEGVYVDNVLVRELMR